MSQYCVLRTLRTENVCRFHFCFNNGTPSCEEDSIEIIKLIVLWNSDSGIGVYRKDMVVVSDAALM